MFARVVAAAQGLDPDCARRSRASLAGALEDYVLVERLVLALGDRFCEEERKSAVLGFSGQVPVWIKLQAPKQLYFKSEVKKRAKKSGSTPGDAGATPGDVESENQTQTRSTAPERADKFRITVELRQVVRNWFAGPETAPVGEHGVAAVVFSSRSKTR